MSVTARVLLALIAAAAISGFLWLRHSANEAEAQMHAQEVATAASAAMNAADAKFHDTMTTGLIDVTMLYSSGDEPPASLAKAAHSLHAMDDALVTTIAARDTLLARSAEWFALEPTAEAPVKETIAKIRAHQGGLAKIEVAARALATALETGAPRATIEQLRNALTTATVFTDLGGG